MNNKTDLVAGSFGEVSKSLSYGGKTLAENIRNAEAAIKKVQYTEKIWDRSRSQFMLKHLTCSQADGWMRLRQVSAEMSRKRQAFKEAKFDYMELLIKAKIKRRDAEKEKDPLLCDLLLVQAAKLESQSVEILIKVQGALKEVELLAEIHDSLKDTLGEINEEAYEKAQVQSHIKRALTQSIREVRECGTIRSGNQEYLEQLGVCVSSARKAIEGYLKEEMASSHASTSQLHAFIDTFAEHYEPVAKQQADWLGIPSETNNRLTWSPEPDEL